MENLTSLVAQARSGDLDAYGKIVCRFQDMAYGYAYSILGDFHLAQDAAQEAFIQAYRDLANLRKPEAFPGWFRRIVFKHCDRITRRKGRATSLLEEAAGVPANEPDPPAAAERREMTEAVLAAIRALPDDQRAATTLFYINGYSQQEVADFLEVPVTTVNNRLAASRKRLKEGVLAMVPKILREKALPEGFGDMIAKLVLFPKTEPEIEITGGAPRRGSVCFIEGQGFFVPLLEGSQTIVSWYDWPRRRLTQTACVKVVGRKTIGGMDCWRVRIPDFDPEKRWVYDHEWYWGMEDGRIYFVAKSNFEPRTKKPRVMTWEHRDWDEDRTGQSTELRLTSRVRWRSDSSGKGPRFPRMLVPGGIWDVTLGDCHYECLRALSLGYKGQRQGVTPHGLSACYRMMAEYFINMAGRTVLFRRYNGPAWPRSADSSVKALARKGCPKLRYNGVEFRLWYDCIPLHAVVESGQ